MSKQLSGIDEQVDQRTGIDVWTTGASLMRYQALLRESGGLACSCERAAK